MLGRAPLDLRVNALKADRDSLTLPEAGEKLASAQGLRFASGTAVEQWEAYTEGLIEVQDLGSQLIVEALPIAAGDTIIDLCAGGGGKTLALAARLGNAANIIAADTDKRRLGNLAPRAARAGAAVDSIVLLDPGREMRALGNWAGKADHVLVDAPCSGSGFGGAAPKGAGGSIRRSWRGSTPCRIMCSSWRRSWCGPADRSVSSPVRCSMPRGRTALLPF